MLSRKLLISLLFIFLSLSSFASCATSDEYLVVRVIDGDTIVLADGRHIRYIGIDTPEKGHPYYSEAKRENERLVKGKKIRLEYDVQKQDRYRRTLAYVYVGEIFVNAELVRNGYALIYTVPPDVKYADTFLELQKQARKDKRGLWGLKLFK